MSTHTPGPWFVEHTGLGLRVVHGEPNASGFRDDVRFHAVTGIATDEEKANARLAAAGPKMLAALRLVVRMHCTPDGHYRDRIGAMKAARDAIAEADGR